MMTISNDISNKISRPIVDVLVQMKEIAESLEIPFFLVGASARDMFFSALFDVKTRRASLDVDIGIMVSSWEEVTRLIDALVATGHFAPINQLRSKFRHQNQTLVDIVPFGTIESPSGKVQWPSSDVIMTTIGFGEALKYSIEVQIRSQPVVLVRISTPPALVMLKLIAWDEKYPERAKDAQDIQYILESYIDAGNDGRLDDEDADLREEEDFDYGMASARIVGRDIARIASADTMSAVLRIIERETDTTSDFKLLTDMTRGAAYDQDRFEQNLRLLHQLRQGLSDRKRKEL